MMVKDSIEIKRKKITNWLSSWHHDVDKEIGFRKSGISP